MATQIHLGDISVDVVQKSIKNIHLSVHPPTGKVRIAAPLHMKVDTIRVFAIAKLGWIKKQQEKLRKQARESPREMIDRESHYVWGRRYLLKVIIANSPPEIELKHRAMVMYVRPGIRRSRTRSKTFQGLMPATGAQSLQDIINAAWKYEIETNTIDDNSMRLTSLAAELTFKTCEVFQIERILNDPQ